MIRIGTNTTGPVTIDPAKIIASRLLIQADSGGGKSYLLRLLAERIAELGEHFIIIDAEGEFASLREKVDSLLLVGSEGDVPATVGMAGPLATMLMERRVSAVLDLYDLDPVQQHQFVGAFCESILRIRKEHYHPLYLFLDEAHEFAPESGRGESCCLQQVAAVAKRGRKRGIALIPATQRFSDLSKQVASACNSVIIGITTPKDTNLAGDLLGVDRKEAKTLTQLAPGEWVTRGPATSRGEPVRFKADMPETEHPEPGVASAAPVRQSPEISDLLPALRALIEDEKKAKEKGAKQGTGGGGDAASAETLEELAAARERIAELEHKLQDALEWGRARSERLYQIRQLAYNIDQEDACDGDQVGCAVGWSGVHGRADAVSSARASVGRNDVAVQEASAPGPDDVDLVARAHGPRLEETHRGGKGGEGRPAARGESVARSTKLTGAQQRVIDAIRWWELLGIETPSTKQVGFVAQMDATGGYFSNVTSPLSSAGLIERPTGAARLTAAGRALASPIETPRTMRAYHAMLRERVRAVGGANRTLEVFDFIIRQGGAHVRVDVIGDALGVDTSGGYFSNLCGPLTKLDLITRGGGLIRPTPLLFPRGLT